MAVTRCEKSDLLTTECAHCLGHDAPEISQSRPERIAPPGYTMPAQYPGSCGSCGDRIKPGQQITRALAGWVCGPCSEEENHL